MSKITKKQLQQSVDLLNKENSSQHDYLMRIKRVLKSIDIDILSDEFDEPKSKLKQLDQSVFNGLDEKWRFAAVDKCGEVWYSTHKTQPSVSGTHLSPEPNANSMQAEGYYDTSNWQNSLIERDVAKELTGSELCKAMLERGDKYVMCQCWCSSYADIEQVMDIVSGFAFEVGKKAFAGVSHNWDYAIPINNQGEPLTAAEVGL